MKISFCLVLVVSLLKLKEWHKQALRVREESFLQETEVSGKDRYSPYLSNPSEAHRLLQLSRCAKCLLYRRSCSLLRTFAMPQPPMVKFLLMYLPCAASGDPIELPMFLFTVTHRDRDLSLLQICRPFHRHWVSLFHVQCYLSFNRNIYYFAVTV